jgi:ankyrin repeat protein
MKTATPFCCLVLCGCVLGCYGQNVPAPVVAPKPATGMPAAAGPSGSPGAGPGFVVAVPAPDDVAAVPELPGIHGLGAAMGDAAGAHPVGAVPAGDEPRPVAHLAQRPNAAPANASDYAGRTAQLMEACEKGRVSLVARMLQTGSDPNDKDDNGQTPLMKACEHGHTALVYLLLSRGATLGDRDQDGRTALMMAAGSGSQQIVKALLAPGSVIEGAGELLGAAGVEFKLPGANFFSQNFADVHARDKDGNTAYLYAARQGFARILQDLRSQDSDAPKHVNAQRQSALMLAAQNGHEDVVRLLLARENSQGLFNATDPLYLQRSLYLKRKDKSGKTAAQLAEEAGHADVAELLRKVEAADTPDAEGQFQLHKALAAGDEAACVELLDLGADVYGRDKTGRTALMVAAQHASAHMVQRILRIGSHNIASYGDLIGGYLNNQEQNALMIAAARGDLSVVSVLAPGEFHNSNWNNYSFYVLNKDKSGKTALQLAEEKGHTRVVEYLKAIHAAHGQ